MVPKSLRCFLQDLVDYAGLFPPAQLPLQEALANYHRYSLGAFKWMLARFVCPATSIEETLRIWRSLDLRRPLRLTVLCPATDGSLDSTQLDHVREAARDAAASIEMLETVFPGESMVPAENWIAGLTARLKSRNLSDVPVFVEAPGGSAARLAPVLAAAEHSGKFGFKLRCGGTDREAVPSVAAVLEVLSACAEQKVPFKATAGLHHPIRFFDSKLGVDSHGFVNLFAAGMLAAGRGLERDSLVACLQETGPEAFEFTGEKLQWETYSLSASEIEDLRSRLLISFGSCSFLEPVEDLAALGWLNLNRSLKPEEE